MRSALSVLMCVGLGCSGKRANSLDASEQIIPASPGTTIHTDAASVTLIRGVNEGNETRFDLLVWTSDPAKSYQFEAWSDNLRTVPSMTDDLGNYYHAINGRRDYLGTTPSLFARKYLVDRGQESPKIVLDRSGQITSIQARADSLRFHSPGPKAERLTLTLPGAAMGLQSSIHLSIKTAELEKGFSLP